MKYLILSVVSSYHLTMGYSAEDISKDISNAMQVVDEICHRNLLIIWADINAAIRNRSTNIIDANDEDMISNLVGPHGNPRINAKVASQSSTCYVN